MTNKFFINRRAGSTRRTSADKRQNPRLDLPHKRRRQKVDRRRVAGSISEDFYALNGLDSADFKTPPNTH
jgi:hypothetical protein